MDPHHAEVLANDDREVHSLKARLVIALKLWYYALQRPVMDLVLRRRLRPILGSDPVFKRVTRFLYGEGGMFRRYAYGKCDRLHSLRGSSVLVPGVGYGKNLLQLAAFRPKEIIAFDLYDYPEVWAELTRTLREEFGVPITFLKGDYDVVPEERAGTFDFIISDAVLEHVPDMPGFAAGSAKFLKPGGIFYASFGPLWYGPSGDHVTWGGGWRLFDHLLLSKEAYAAQLQERSLRSVQNDSCDPGFMVQEGFFSYVKAAEYLDDLAAAGFALSDVEVKIPAGNIELLRRDRELNAALDRAGAPLFDRFANGFYLWLEKKSPRASEVSA